MTSFVRLLPAIACLLMLGTTATLRSQPPAQQGSQLRWFKGNTHTHTVNSDGDSTPDEVVRWYREHGYNFLVLTDHNYLTSVDGLNALHGAIEKFLVIAGEEVTSTVEKRPVHVNGLSLRSSSRRRQRRSARSCRRASTPSVRPAAFLT